MDEPVISIGPLREEHVEAIVEYLANLSTEDMARMGIDPKRMLSREKNREFLVSRLNIPDKNRDVCYVTWLLDDKIVGMSSIKHIEFGKTADIHLHVFSRDLRGKGLGPRFFCMSAIYFYERFSLRSIICEPASGNPGPNKMLQKIGFPKVKTYTCTTSTLIDSIDLTVYDIDRKIVELFLNKEN